MTFEQKFDALKSKFDKADVKSLNGEYAIEFTMTDEDCGGIFYIKVSDKSVDVQPYNYYDNSAAVSGKAADIAKIAGGTVPASLAIIGNADTVAAFAGAYKSAKPATKKPAAKKTVAKKTADKTVDKACTKTAAKTAAKTTAKTVDKAAAKTVAKVAEKVADKATTKAADKKASK